MRAALLLIALPLSACTVLVGGHLEKEPPEQTGPPDPSSFTPATCEATSPNPAGEVEIGAGYEGFLPAADNPLEIIDVDGTSYVYFSVRTRGLEFEDACVEFRLDIDDPSRPNEVVAFDRYQLDLEPIADGRGQQIGMPIPIDAADIGPNLRARLVVQVADRGFVSARSEVFTEFE